MQRANSSMFDSGYTQIATAPNNNAKCSNIVHVALSPMNYLSI